MQDAIDKITGKFVDAADARRASHYICTKCRRPVTLRSGPVREPYFAHAWGVGDEDCDLYAAAQLAMSSGKGAGAGERDSEYVAPSLELTLKLAKNKDVLTWGLELSVTAAGMSAGSITVDVGGRVSQIRLEGNTKDRRTVIAEPHASLYKVIQVDLGQAAENFEGLDCAGLSEHGFTVFGDMRQIDGTALKRTSKVLADRTYVLVWQTHCELSIHPDVTAKLLEARSGWIGAIVTVPSVPSEECKLWLENNAGVTIVGATSSILPVWPPLIRAFTSRHIEAPPGTNIITFLDHLEAGGSSKNSPLFARSEHGDTRVAKVDEGSAPFYKVMPAKDKGVQLTCRACDGLDLIVEFSLDIAQLGWAVENVVMLIGVDLENTPTAIALHSEGAREWLLGVGNGSIRLTAMRAPFGVRGRLKSGKNQSWDTTYLIAESDSPEPGKFDFSTEVLNRFAQILMDGTLDLLVDFGAFGQVKILARNEVRASKELGVPAKLLGRIKNYLIRYPSKSTMPLKLSELSPKQLAGELVRPNPSRSGVVLQRVLISELNAHLQNQSYSKGN